METTVNANVVLRNNNVSGTVVTGGSNTGTATASILVATPRAVASTRRNVYNADASTNESTLHATVTERWIFNHNELHNLGYNESGHTGFQRSLIEGVGIEIIHGLNGDTINCTVNGAEWGNISGDIENQLDLISKLAGKQDVLTAGQNISILNNTISAVDTKYTQGTGITIDQNNVVSNNVSPLVPAQATINNQLADKDFVNSSIATSTATFKGTVTASDDTEASAQTALSAITGMDDNDYAFVKVPDTPQTGVGKFKRYKYNGTSWVYEYTLNNSSFTAAQWSSINSGITSGKVTQYDGYATSKQDTLTAGSGISLQNGNINTQNIIWRTW